MTLGMKDSAFRAYEEYVLKDKKLEEGQKNLIEGSSTYNYLKCIDLLTKNGANLNPEDEAFVQNYIVSNKTTESRKIQLRYDLLKYDIAKTASEKKALLQVIATNHLELRLNHQRPADLGIQGSLTGISQGHDKIQEEEKPLLDEIDVKAELEHLYERTKSVGNFSKTVLSEINFDMLLEGDFMNLMVYMGEDIVMIDSALFYKTYAKWLNESFRERQHYGLNANVLQNMTIQQMDKLRAQVPGIGDDATFASIYMSKKFSRELSEEENSNLTYQEKRENLIAMYNYAKGMSYNLSGLKSSLLLEILENGLKINEYNESYFIEYLKQPLRENFSKLKVAPNSEHWRNTIQNVQVEHNRRQDYTILRNKDTELLTKYLEHFFKKGLKIEKFEEYLDKTFLVRVWEDTMLTSGQKLEFSSENPRLEKLAIDVIIQLADYNKDLFKIGDDITIFVELKNVPTLYIKVFEINTENYYRKNMTPFKTDVNLDGLVASNERTVEYKQSPKIKFTEKLLFPELKNKPGLYVIELIGNGKSSRAILKVGTLSFIIKNTIAGQICTVLDGERKVCCHESTGIYIDNQLYKANTSKGGRIIVPYLPSGGARTAKAILLHQNLAQLVDFQRNEEGYQLRCGFFLLPESMLLGKKASILIRPQLLINGRTADISLLKNIQCTLCTTNYIDNLPASETFKNLTLSENKELIVEFQVGPNISSMSINFSGEVINLSKGKPDVLSCSHAFTFSTHIDTHSIAELYMRFAQDASGYELYALGKNGEPIVNAPVQLNFISDYFTYPIERSAITNKTGSVKLGFMRGVTMVNASLIQSSGKSTITKSWALPDDNLMLYPSSIDIIEKEEIELPITAHAAKNPCYLKSINNTMTLANYSKNIIIEKSDKSLYGLVKIKGLQSGSYVLFGPKHVRITIKVHKGEYWSENPSYILKKHSLLENMEKQGFVKIQSVKLEDLPEKKMLLSIGVEGATKDQWRVHVMFFRYLPENLNELTFRLLSKDDFIGSEYFFQKWTNFYLSGRELSTEFRYCFDRRNLQSFTGNTLDKPKLLLKRTLVQSTHAEQQAYNTGTAYSLANEMAAPLPQQNQQRANIDDFFLNQQSLAAPAQYKIMSQPCLEIPDMMRRPSSPREWNGRQIDISSASSSRISSFQDFLGSEPFIIYNFPANAEGKLLIELDQSLKTSFACMLILAVDKGSVAHLVKPLNGTNIHKRDLSLDKPLDPMKYYSEIRAVKCIEKFESYLIQDLTSPNLRFIDSLDKILKIIQEIMRLHGTTAEDLDKFEKVINWDLLKEEDKNKMMSKYSSHELHLFIYKKDPNYFKKVVRPYLVNKMEKTFMDYYLLSDLKKIASYASKPSLLVTLNSLEKALLIETLAGNKQGELAFVLASRMRDSLALNKKSNAELNRIFDAVLSSNALKAGKEEIETMINKEIGGDLPPLPPPPPPPPPGGIAMPMVANRMLNENPYMFGEQNQIQDPFNNFNPMPVSSLNRQSSVEEARKPMKKGFDLFDDDDDYGEARARFIPSLAEMGETKEYCETHYYNSKQLKCWTGQVIESEFWADYAEHCINNAKLKMEGKKPFMSCAFTNAYHNLTEVIACLSLLDLPYRSVQHGFRTLEGRSAELKAASNMIIFKKEVKETKNEIRSNILVAQRFVDWEFKGDEDSLIEEFLVNHIYTGQVIITNISSKKLEFDVLVQIPQGSLPIGIAPYQKSHSLSLESYSTRKIEYQFYFPKAGKYIYFPPNVSIDSTVVAVANKAEMKVVVEKSKISEENFREIVCTGNHDYILKFLKQKPIDTIMGFSWDDVYWMLPQSESFYNALLNLFKEQARYDPVVWSYSLLYKNDESTISEYLNSIEYYKSSIGFYFDSSLVSVRPIDSNIAHLDYYPLMNPRAHKISAFSTSAHGGAQKLILNTSLYNTYQKFIFYLIEKKDWDIIDKMNLVYYLILQDRIKEALNVYGRINADKEIGAEGTLRLQYDYMSAYLDFYTGGPEFKIARKIVDSYINYPVITWRLMFLDMDQQLKEYDGQETEEIPETTQEERKDVGGKRKAISVEPQLSVVLDGKDLILDYSNIPDVVIKYYIIDLEILFSRAPFLTQNTDDFSFVQPNSIVPVTLDSKMNEAKIKIPVEFSKKNVLIEVTGSGIQRLVTYFSTSLKCLLFENYGELKVTDEAGRQLSQVYVKVFAMKKDNSVMFYKDGYTDIRGRFDYVTLNASMLSQIQKFALFVMSDKHGSLIKETQPPAVTKREEEELGPVKTRVANYYAWNEKKKSKKTADY